jgi:hypothetical protein
MSTCARWILGSLLMLLLSAMPAIGAEDPCTAFTWDVHHERALFATPGEALAGARTSAGAPALKVERLYNLTLAKRAELSFTTKPATAAAGDSDYGALLHLTVPEAGTWRISLESKLWVDVLADGVAIASSDFQGRPGCSAPHKIVEFVLPAGKVLTVQLSGAAAPTVKLSVTRTAARAP